MKPNQDLFYITTQVLTELKKVITTVNPSLVMVQGDTTTAMAAALAAFYLQKPIAHIEAGLRTNDIYNPFPEEINRRFISQIASYHFAPTQNAVDNLIKENMHENIYRTGNTVVDALNIILNKIALNELTINQQIIDLVQQTKACNKQIVIITAHRRENVEHRLYHIFNALHQICLEFDQVQFIYPMHPNPKIKSIALNCQLFELKNMVITSALSYQEMVYLLSHCDLVITDSGGLQEEAISLEKPVVILRKKTERYEAIECGLGFLGGTKFNTIYSAFLKAFSKSKKDFNTLHVYGDGFASERIIKKIKKDFFS